MLILITNDDGIAAEGLSALRESLGGMGRVVTVAPDREQSASSHAITLHAPLRIQQVGEDAYTVDGTPTDCVLVAMNGLLDTRPDVVISGINHGPNMGDDVTYSGTVSAAFEGAILGVPSIAVSLATFGERNFEAARASIPKLLEAIARHELPPRALLNVNVPSCAPDELRGFRITKLGHRVYEDTLVARKDPRGRDYYWIGGGEPSWNPDPETDFLAIDEGFVSVTPLSLDLTHLGLHEAMQSWEI
jgi:5'-nucleotidase